MQTLPSDFLTKIAHKYELSPEQEDAFLARFSKLNDNEPDIAEALHISHNAFRTRMTGVYGKFSIGGKGPGKFRKLHDFLLQEYQKTNPIQVSEVLQNDINTIVQTVREQIKPLIQEYCGKIWVLDMTYPVNLNDIYIDINILEEIPGQQRPTSDKLEEYSKSRNFERLGTSEKTLSLLETVEKHPKLVIWGKPGSGKTTLLKYLAMHCIEGKFKADYVPFFIPLKEFAEAENRPRLIEYISDNYFQPLLPKNKVLDEGYINELIINGKALMLLDGLDEVRKEDNQRVLKEIEKLYKHFKNNHFIVTCRIAALPYKILPFFQDLAIADLVYQQIVNLANNWFKDQPKQRKTFNQQILIYDGIINTSDKIRRQ